MTGSCNLASLSRTERMAVQADLVACRIRWECRALKGAERQRRGQELLRGLSAGLYPLVVEQLRVRSGSR